MKDLLDELYDYDLFHLTANDSKDEEYRAALNKLVGLEADILKALPEIKVLLEEYQSIDNDLIRISNRSDFRMGVRFGAQLMLEMMRPLK